MMEDPLPHPLTRAPLLGPPVGTGLALGVPIREAAAAAVAVAVAVFGPRSLSHWKRSSGQSWRQRLGLSVEEPQSSQL